MKRRPVVLQDCGTCARKAASVVCDLVADDLVSFQRIKQFFHYEPCQTVFYEGHACLGLYLLCSGKVKLTRSSLRGRRQITNILDAGQLVEKHAFQDGAVHEAICETIESSQVCLIEKRAYFALLRRNPDLAVRLIHLLSAEIGARLDQLDQFTFRTARERLAHHLLRLAAQFGRENRQGVQVDLSLTREEIAELSGMTVETAVRLLGAFRREGLIGVDGRRITLVNRDRLARISRST